MLLCFLQEDLETDEFGEVANNLSELVKSYEELE